MKLVRTCFNLFLSRSSKFSALKSTVEKSEVETEGDWDQFPYYLPLHGMRFDFHHA